MEKSLLWQRIRDFFNHLFQREERVQCPKCSNSISIQLSETRGTTEVIKCNKCQFRFNVHRVSNNEIYVPSFSVNQENRCPHCNEQTPFQVRYDGNIVAAVCNRCGKRSNISKNNDPLPIVSCPLCGKGASPMPGNYREGIDRTCNSCGNQFSVAVGKDGKLMVNPSSAIESFQAQAHK